MKRKKPVPVIFGSVPGAYPATVVTAGLQAVWDLRVGGSGTVGPRTPLTKVLGVDTLETGMSYDNRFLHVVGTHTFSNWDFSTIAHDGYVYTDGTGTVTFNDCKFAFHTAPIAGNTYCLNAGDPTGTVTTICNYCIFDGKKVNSAFPSSAVNVVSSTATLQLDHCDIVNQPADGLKSLGALVVSSCRIQNVGWYVGSDPDGVQIGGGTIDFQNNLIDVRDGSGLGDSYTGQPLNNFFRAESFGAAITGVTCKNNIMVGISGYGTIPGAYTSVDAIDVNPNAVSNVLYQNNVIQKGRNAYTYADGSTRYPHLTAPQWVTNIDFDTGATIAVP